MKKESSPASGELGGKSVTYYLHDTIRNDSGYEPVIREHRLTTKYDTRNREWIVTLPHATSLILADATSKEEALQGGGERLLRDNWTTDRALAVRRAAKMLELKAAGKMKFDGPRSVNQKACVAEILAVK